MAFRKKGLASYGEVEVQSGTAYADSVQLIQMLFDGLIDSWQQPKVKSNEMKLTQKASHSVGRHESSWDCRDH